MNGPILTLFAVIIAASFVTGALGLLWPRQAREAVGIAAAGLAGLAGMLALAVLLLPGASAVLALPVGLPGTPLRLALDPLSDGFLLLISITATASGVFAAKAAPTEPAVGGAALPVALGGLMLAILAADGLTLALGLALGGGAIWSMGRRGDLEQPSTAPLAVALGAAAAVIVALGLLAPSAADLSFAAIRAGPVDPGRAAIAVLVAIAGLGALIGLVPLHAWLVPAHRALPASAAALLSGALLPTGLYVLVRVVLDLGARAPPLAAELPLLSAGAISVLLGGWRACREDTLDAAVACGALRQSGMAAIGLGLAVIGRSADLPDPATLALSAVILLACMQAICGTLALLAAGAIHQQAGTRRLDRLGGLIHRMPLSSLGLLAGLGGLSSVPPAPGFAALFLLFHAVLAGPHSGGLGMPLLLLALVLVPALGSVLATLATVRVVGVTCLGRPRLPRAAAADEVPRAARRALLAPLILTCGLGVLPGPALRLLAGPAIAGFTGAPAADRLGWLTLVPNAGSSGYAPLPLALLLLIAGGAAVWWLRRRARSDVRLAPVWQGGFAGPPPWLPFGDPLTQWNGALVPSLPLARSTHDRAVTAGAAPAAGPRETRPGRMSFAVARLVRAGRRVSAPTVALIAVAALLALLAWPGPP